MTLVDLKKEVLSEFFRQSGYGPGELLSLSYVTNTFLTRNGGKYQMINGKIRHLAGPSPDASERM